jgi:hypothetical protein
MHYAPKMAWVNSPFLVLVREHCGPNQHDEDESKQLLSYLGTFLKKLRHVSGQADMPKQDNLLAMMLGEIDILPELAAMQDHSGTATIQTYPLAVAVTRANVEAAAALPDDFSPPIHSVLILDAISAFLASDHRISILFSAMAMEIGFGAALEAAYDVILQGRDDPRYRVLKIPIGAGKFATKDPVYDRLRGRDDFSLRMHEMALYVLGKSLREDKDAVYKNALILYRSRNKIVHLGTTEDAQEEVLPVDREGAETALRTAVDCLTWLGLNPGIKLPKLQFLTGEDFKTFARALDA